MPEFNRHALLAMVSFSFVFGASAGIIYDNGAPDPTSGGSSREMTKCIQADNFTLVAPARIESIKFWDYESTPTFANQIFWQILSNDADNSPGMVVFSGTSLNLSHVATGNSIYGYPEHIISFDLSGVSLPAGKYWLALHNGPLANTDGLVFWQPTNRVDATPSDVLYLIPSPNWIANLWYSHAAPSEFAFQLSGTPIPAVSGIGFSGGTPAINFSSVTGAHYLVEYKNAFTDASWTTVSGAGNISGTGSVIQVTDPDPNAGRLSRRFYRVSLL